MHVHIQGEHLFILFPLAINLFWLFMSSIKHPFGLNVTCKPCSTIWPMETIFFVMVGTRSTYFKYFVYPSCMDNGTLLICVMGCVVSSPISINPSVFKSFSKPLSMISHVVWSSKIHIPNIVIRTPPIIEFSIVESQTVVHHLDC